MKGLGEGRTSINDQVTQQIGALNSANLQVAMRLVQVEDDLKTLLEKNENGGVVKALEEQRVALTNELVGLEASLWTVVQVQESGAEAFPASEAYPFTDLKHGLQLQALRFGQLRVFPYTFTGSAVATPGWDFKVGKHDQMVIQTPGNTHPFLKIATFDTAEDAQEFLQNPVWRSEMSHRSSDRLTAIAPLPKEAPGVIESVRLFGSAVRRLLGF